MSVFPSMTHAPKKAHGELFTVFVVFILSFSSASAVMLSIIQYYNRDNVGWNVDSLEYLDAYYGRPVRGIVHYRVLTIGLARALPDLPSTLFSPVRTDNPDWQPILKFALINSVALGSCGIAFYYYQRQLKLEPTVALIGVLVFYVSRTVIQGTIPPMVDAISFLTWILILHALLVDNMVLLIISFIIGMLNKETMMFAIILIPLTTQPWGVKAKHLLSLVALSVVYIPLRSILFPGAATSYNFNLDMIADSLIKNLSAILSLRALFDLFSSFTFIWVLFFYGVWQKNYPRQLRNWLWLIPILLASIIVFSGNLGRTLFLTFPVVIPVAMCVIQNKLLFQPLNAAE